MKVNLILLSPSRKKKLKFLKHDSQKQQRFHMYIVLEHPLCATVKAPSEGLGWLIRKSQLQQNCANEQEEARHKK